MTHCFPSQSLSRFSIEVRNLLKDFDLATANHTIQVRENSGDSSATGKKPQAAMETDSVPCIQAVLVV